MSSRFPAANNRILTHRLVLRRFIEEDFSALRRIDGDPEVLRYRSKRQISEEMTREFLRQAQTAATEHPQTRFPYAILLQPVENRSVSPIQSGEGPLIGQIGLTRLDENLEEAFLWYSIQRDYWGKGYATEAGRAIVGHGFSHLSLDCIHAGVHADNLASVRVLEKLGMQQVKALPVQSQNDHLEYQNSPLFY